MAILRLFASARDAAGEGTTCIDAATVDEMLDEAVRLYGAPFRQVLATSRVWVNGQPADGSTPVSSGDVVAVLPPVSGGASRTSTASRGLPARPPVRPPQPPPGLRPAPQSPFAVTPPVRGAEPPERDLDPWEEPAARSADPWEEPAARVADPWPEPPERELDPWGEPPERAGERSHAPPPPPAARRPPPPPPPPPVSRRSARPAPAPATARGAGRTAGEAVVGTLARAPEPADPRAATAVRELPGDEREDPPPLAVVPRTTRPHGRLGVAWALGTTTVTVAGPFWLALWMGFTAAAAASQAAGVWRARRERPLPAFAAAVALALPLSALAGAVGINAALAVALLSMLVARLAAQTVAPARDVALTLLVGLPVGLAAAAPVMLTRVDPRAALLLLASAAVYDAGAYLVGTGASSTWEGPVAGIAALVPLTLIAMLTFDPPFAQSEALRLGLVAAVLAPFGPLAGSALLGDRNAAAPALRRIDSLVVMGPVWALCALAFLG